MAGFCSSPRFVEHDTGATHPERPDRIRAIATAVRKAGLIDSPTPFPDFDLDFGPLPPIRTKLHEIPEPAPADEKWLRAVHPQPYIDRIRHVCTVGGGVLDQGDTPVGPESFEIARLATGAVLACCDAVITGQMQRAFAAVRPPGHHAEPLHPMGFCLFANVSIAARYLQQAHGVGRIAIVDFDVHHGNGTQAVFEDDPSVLFISLHQDPRTCYPGTGYAYEVGVDAGRGFTLNLPFPPGAGDDEYLDVMRSRVLPKLDEFRPEFLLISAGFDAHFEDPLAQIELTDEAFGQITQMLVESADRHCGGRIVSALEGGYNLRALGRSVVRHLIALT
ncbi:MAG TPA: histone deacetylase [Tepidisphaeraceae bacterium]|jgi:acetoin utilization deacetylase AcuC-like enzyme